MGSVDPPPLLLMWLRHSYTIILEQKLITSVYLIGLTNHLSFKNYLYTNVYMSHHRIYSQQNNMT